MSRLPPRPLGNSAERNDSTPATRPLLGADSPSVATGGAEPRFATNLPKQPPVGLPTHVPPVPKVKAYQRPVAIEEPEILPTYEEEAEPEVAAESAISTSVSAAPASQASTIENISFDNVVSEEEVAAQFNREQAINRMPQELKQSIRKLFELIMDEESSEVTINGPHSVGFKRNGQRFVDNEIDFIDTEKYHAVINSFLLPLTNTKDRIGDKPYLIEGQLIVPDDKPGLPPLVARVHMVVPPAVDQAKITIAKKARRQYSVDSMVATGSMTKAMAQFLKDIARGRATVVFSGISGSGKTTLLEAMSREFDVSDRIVLVEDTEELSLPAADLVPLRSRQVIPGEDVNQSVSLEWLVRQANRMRPDRIIVGEVRGSEMAEFLTAANSGADGSMTTVHASSAQEAINKMLSLSMKSGNVKSEISILRDIAASVQIIVQLGVIDNKYKVLQIEEISNTVNRNTMGIQTATIFKFDRNTGRFTFDDRPSDEFNMFLKQRGVTLNLPNALGY
jgi:pilus assembly protein CpaF